MLHAEWAEALWERGVKARVELTYPLSRSPMLHKQSKHRLDIAVVLGGVWGSVLHHLSLVQVISQHDLELVLARWEW